MKGDLVRLSHSSFKGFPHYKYVGSCNGSKGRCPKPVQRGNLRRPLETIDKWPRCARGSSCLIETNSRQVTQTSRKYEQSPRKRILERCSKVWGLSDCDHAPRIANETADNRAKRVKCPKASK
eukprot:GHVT01030563.1.p1 GENE.GHVT01030563.1~~GHVT01030563.1.p1  ORF type:complete len:123 (-),score=1.79 GHVT01030563.1:168-536(-)